MWRTIPSFPDYEIDHVGRVRRTVRRQGGAVGRILQARLDQNGYIQVRLRLNRTEATRCVHTLVANAFHGPCPDGHEVNHKNAIKQDNHFRNLEYATHRSNLNHAAELQLRPKRLSKSDVATIRAQRGLIPQAELASQFGVHQTIISKVQLGRIY